MHIPDKVISKNFPVLLLVYAIFCYSLTSARPFHIVHNSFALDTSRPDTNKGVKPLLLRDTLPLNKQGDTTRVPDSTKIIVSDTFNLKLSKDSLEAPIIYKAEDSMVYDVPAKTITLYGKEAKTDYKDNELTAPLITLEQESGNINAIIKRDSSGKVISMPTFKQGTDFTSTSDTIRFNLKSGKGITKSTYTQQGEMYVYGEVIKKVSPQVFYVKRGRFTTCNLDTPHFAFISNRVKFISKKVGISGPVHPEFEGVPIPIYLPFGIFPLNSSRHSGFLPPTFTANEQLGLGLEGLGYYKIIGDYWDVVTRANLYSYGGWTLGINPRYSKKYRYSGTIGLDIQNFKYNFKGDPDFHRNRSYNIRWSHSMDTKARPGVTFSANVNAGSSSFNSYVPNNPYQNFSNQLTSSIVYSKTWKDKPFNLTVSANHNQNNIQKLINVNLPDVAFNVNTLYPFRKKEAAGNPAWYENLGIGYQGNAKSLFAFYDTTSNIMKHIIDTLQWGAHHSIPITLSLPPISFLQVTPGVSYDATTYQHKIVRRWDPVNKRVDTTTYKGVYFAQQASFNLGLSTRIFGMFVPKKKDSKLVAIRHELRPSLGFSYKPDLTKGTYNYIQVDTTGRKLQLPVYEGNIFSPYSPGKFGGINFGLDNNLTMKVRNKKDTSAGGTRKITLLDGLSINGSYNLMADSFRLSNLEMSARSTLFDKVSITAGATFDPYEINERGQRLKTLIWKRKPISLGRMTNANISLSSHFQGGDKSTQNKNNNTLAPNNYSNQPGYTPDDMNNELVYIRNNPAEFTDFSIPWSLNFSYAMRYNKIYTTDYNGFKNEVSQDVSFSGTLGLTPKWQISLNGFYNITQKELGTISVSLAREMHCWQMSINMSPVGRYRFFSINISPKSPILRDLKINRTRYFYDL